MTEGRRRRSLPQRPGGPPRAARRATRGFFRPDDLRFAQPRWPPANFQHSVARDVQPRINAENPNLAVRWVHVNVSISNPSYKSSTRPGVSRGRRCGRG